jgi:hypothetical protein
MSITLAPPPPLEYAPRDYVGPLHLPNSQRWVWWTGRVAIGLRHQPPPPAPGSQAELVQAALLRRTR